MDKGFEQELMTMILEGEYRSQQQLEFWQSVLERCIAAGLYMHEPIEELPDNVVPLRLYMPDDGA